MIHLKEKSASRWLTDLHPGIQLEKNSEAGNKQVIAMEHYAVYQLELWEKQGKWISVENELPEDSGRYLCSFKSIAGSMFIVIAFFSKEDHGVWLNTEDKWNKIVSSNTYWMPLPEPPLLKK